MVITMMSLAITGVEENSSELGFDYNPRNENLNEDTLFLVRKSVLGNVLLILCQKSVLTEITNMVFLLRYRLRLILASS